MPTADLSQVAQPSNDLQYLVYAFAVALVLVILGLAWIRAKYKADSYTGDERRVTAVEDNIGRFAHVEKLISDLATQVAVLTVEVRAVNASMQEVKGRLSELESRLLTHIISEEQGKKK
jgi:uncharacterized coiled-coil protein SlyX